MSRLVSAEPRAAVTVMSGFRAAAMQEVGGRLLATNPAAVLVRHDLAGLRDGLVRRVVSTHDAVLEDEAIQLVHGCVSCTLREDVLPTLARLGRDDPSRPIILSLPEVIEPEAVAHACLHCLIDGDLVTRWTRFDSFLTVVDADSFLDDFVSIDDLVHRDMQAADEDDRGVAAVIARQIEFADTVVLWHGGSQDSLALDRLRTLLHRLAPWAIHHIAGPEADFPFAELLNVARSEPDRSDSVARGLEGYRLGVHEPESDTGVSSVVFRTRRPMHPQRLHDTLEEIAGSTLRSRGHVWLATQPELVLGWESAGGGIALGGLGRWLAALPENRWAEASDLRRINAQLDWDPYYGDRGNHLALIGIGVDPDDLHRSLVDCLLTDEEIAMGEDGWRDLPDPFAGCFTITDESEGI